MRIVLDFTSAEPGGHRQWTVTIDDDTNDPDASANLTRTQAKRIAGELDQMIHETGQPAIETAQRVGNAHMPPAARQ